MSAVTLFRATLRRVPTSQRLAATLRNSAGTETSGTVLEGILEDEGRSFEGGSAVQRGVHQVALLAEGLAFAPAIGMQLTVADVSWVLLDVDILEPTDGGAPILYRLTAER